MHVQLQITLHHITGCLMHVLSLLLLLSVGWLSPHSELPCEHLTSTYAVQLHLAAMHCLSALMHCLYQ